MAEYVEDDYIRVDTSKLKNRNGIGIDIGGSLIKVAYTVLGPEPSALTVHFTAFARTNVDDAVSFIKEKCPFLKAGDLITCTGIGCHAMKVKLKDALGVDLDILVEQDMFVGSLRFLLAEYRFSDVMYQTTAGAIDNVAALMAGHQAQLKIMDKFKDKLQGMQRMKLKDGADVTQGIDAWEPAREGEDVSSSVPEIDPEEMKRNIAQKFTSEVHPDSIQKEDLYPCLMAFLGSGVGIVEIQADGKVEFVDLDPLCGRSFLGLGALLTGAKTYGELAALAAAGDSARVNVHGADLKVAGDTSDIYSVIPDGLLVYCMGKAAGAGTDDFRKEDVAAALLETICQNLARNIYKTAALWRVRHVFLAGSFPGQSAAVRGLIDKTYFASTKLTRLRGQVQSQCHFMKHGGYLGALGTLLIGLGYQAQQ